MLYALASTALMSGCEGPTCDREPPLTYENWGEAYISDFCVGCHSSLVEGAERRGATVGVDFNTYGDVMRQVDRIEARGTGPAGRPASVPARPDFTLPPSGGPNEEQVRIFEEWLTCGVRPDAEALEAE